MGLTAWHADLKGPHRIPAVPSRVRNYDKAYANMVVPTSACGSFAEPAGPRKYVFLLFGLGVLRILGALSVAACYLKKNNKRILA